MPFEAFYLNPDGRIQTGLTEAEAKDAVESNGGLLWVDISETSEDDGKLLEQVFKLHPLTIEDCTESVINNPKVEEFGDYLFMVFHGINYASETQIIETTELDVFLGPNYLVTNHHLFFPSINAIARLVELDGRPMRRGVDFFAHAVIDALIDNIVPVVDQLEERADAIEEILFQSPHPSTLEAILHLKRSSLRLRRAMVPQREVLNRLSRGEFGRISEEASVYYRDIYDAVARIESFIDNLRDRTDTILATYMSVVANQQNETMKTLSLIAAIFLPLSLLAGVYGMNFENMPELGLWWGYYAVLGSMVVAAAGIVWWFWARKWVTAGRKRLEHFVPTAVDPERIIGYVGHMTRWPVR